LIFRKHFKTFNTMKKIVRILQTNTGLRAFLTLIMFMTVAIVFAQDSTTTTPVDSTNDVWDWIARIFTVIGILVPGWDIYKAGARTRAARAQTLFTTFVNMIDNNDFSAPALKNLANQGRDVVKKDGPSKTE
jgi:cation transport ATPase